MGGGEGATIPKGGATSEATYDREVVGLNGDEDAVQRIVFYAAAPTESEAGFCSSLFEFTNFLAKMTILPYYRWENMVVKRA